MPKLPQSKGLDHRVSEPQVLELFARPGEGGRGMQVGKGGYPNRTTIFGTAKTTFPTVAHYKWEKGWRQIYTLTKFPFSLVPNSQIPCFSQFPLCSLYKCLLIW